MSDTTHEAAQYWAIREGLRGLPDAAARQLYLDVTTALVAALDEAKNAGRGIGFEPLWHEPPFDRS